MFQLSRDEQVALVAGLVLISVITLSFFLVHPGKSSEGTKVDIPVSNTSAIMPSNNIKAKIPEMIYVHVSGEVLRPKVYQMPKGSRVFEAVDLAGLTQESYIDGINLAKVLNDGEKVVIPVRGSQMSPDTNLLTSHSSVRADGLININTASQKELESLPGIGVVYASRIIEYRSTTPFRKKEDLMNVRGIGNITFQKLKDKISVE